MSASPSISSSSTDVEKAYEHVLAAASVRSCSVEVGAGHRVHLLERGDGPPLLLLHGTTAFAKFYGKELGEFLQKVPQRAM